MSQRYPTLTERALTVLRWMTVSGLQQTYSLSPEELAERDRPVSRQQRRKLDRDARKSQTRRAN